MRVLFGIVVLLMLVVRLYNGPDAAPSAGALRWSELPRNTVPDADNAWLLLAGLDAPADQEPYALGRRRLDAYEARVQGGPGFGHDAALTALLQEVREPGAPAAPSPRSCPRRDIDCIEWAGMHGVALDPIEDANALRLQRYERALDLVHYEEAATPALLDHTLDTGVATVMLHLDLLARDIARGLAPAEAIPRLLRVTRFWRRAGAQARSAGTKLLAYAALERSMWLADSLVDRLEARDLKSLRRDLQEISAPHEATLRDFTPELRVQLQSFAHGMREQFGVRGLLGGCVAAPASCVSNLVMSQAYSHQSTLNLMAASADAGGRLQAAPPAEWQAALQRYGDELRAANPVLDGDFVQPFVARNPTGRILAAIALPSAEWIARRNDLEVLQRMFALKLDARLRDIGTDAMPRFVASRPADQRDPYRNAPFTWNAALEELRFAPAAAYWQRPAFRVAMRSPEPPGVRRCAHPMQVTLRRRLDETRFEPIGRAITCDRFDATDVESLSESEEYDRNDPVVRIEHAWLGATPDGANLRLLYRDDGDRLLGYERLALAADGEYRMLDALGHDDGAVLEARVVPAPERVQVRVLVRNEPIGTLVDRLVGALGVRVDGLPGECRASRVTLNFNSIALGDVMSLLGDECGRWIHVLGPTAFRFSTEEPDA